MLQILTVLTLVFLGSVISYYTGTNGWIVLGWYLLLLVVVILFLKNNGTNLRDVFLIKPRILLKSLLYVPILYLALLLVGLFFPQTDVAQGSLMINAQMILALTFVGPLAEEVTFRVYFQDLIRKKFGINATIVFSSLFFALLHPVNVFPQAFVIAVFLGSLRETYGSVTPSVLIHCLNNTIALMFNVLT